MKLWSRALKRDVVAMGIAARSSARTPLLAKLVTAGVAAYALSPIDLIPDFISVIKYLDVLFILPLGITLEIRLIPAPLMANYSAEALLRSDRPVTMSRPL
ncbi:MAG: DUF1232 domain-containing protein [Parasphingorhabdus sp.]|uniref:YkvA family protein n=1 Tax=Parasphingorhabdus sp. TaxID=2709688 RepID=UPI003001B54C|tara:strand:- start:1234 stop:1536 length:303 start_codon:yes stop_codon:yes gene_type:complete